MIYHLADVCTRATKLAISITEPHTVRVALRGLKKVVSKKLAGLRLRAGKTRVRSLLSAYRLLPGDCDSLTTKNVP